MVKRKLTVCETLFVRSGGRWVRERLHTCASLCCYVLVSLHNAAAVAGVVFLVVVVRVGIYLHVRVNECVVPAAWDRERARDLFFLKSLVRLKKKKKKRNFSSVQSNAISPVVGAGHSRRREKLSVRLKLSSLAKNIHVFLVAKPKKWTNIVIFLCNRYTLRTQSLAKSQLVYYPHTSHICVRFEKGLKRNNKKWVSAMTAEMWKYLINTFFHIFAVQVITSPTSYYSRE